jgi:hypothetical protein
MVEPLFTLLQLGVEDTHAIFAYFVVDELAIATIIRETVSVRLGNRDIKHIGAIVAEFHFVYGVLRQFVYADLPVQFLLLDAMIETTATIASTGTTIITP